ncbi:MAG: recombinase family protein [Flavobacteriaceae bacterium]
MKYVAYFRVSTKGQGESGLGLDAQKAFIKHYLNENDIVANFTDVQSGKTLDRPQLKEAIKLCKENGYGLAIAKLDRLSRTTEDILKVFNELDGYLYSCDIPMQKGQKIDKFTLTLFSAIADREREMISIRTKQALQALKAKGVKLGKPENLTDKSREKAYKANAEKASKNENNKRATSLICALRNYENKTYREIAEKLNADGFKTSRGKAFSAMQVQRLYKRNCDCKK